MDGFNLLRNLIRGLVLPVIILCCNKAIAQEVPLVLTPTDSLGDTVYLLHKAQVKANLLQSVATIKTPELITTPAPSFLQALPGRIAGLYTRQRSGVQDTDNPTSVIDFKIRGQVPLILIDGVPRDFASIEPESIETISVLKDALSTVLLGQRSSNNVIQVTTQRPRATPFRLSFTAQHGMQQLINKTKTVSAADYAILYNEARNNDGLAPVYSATDIMKYRDGSDPLFHPNNDYQQYFLNKTASLDRFNLNIQNGNQVAKFYVALDYQKEGGFFNTADLNAYSTNSGVDRYIVRSNADINLNKTLNLALNIFGRIQNSNQPGSGTSNIISAITYTPNNAYSIFNPDSSLGGNANYTNNIYGMLNQAGYIKSMSRDLSTDLILTQRLDRIIKGLWAKGQVSYNNSIDQSVNRSKSFAVYDLSILTGAPVYRQLGAASNQPNTLSLSSRRTYTYGKLSLGYDQSWNDHQIQFLALADNQETTINLDLPAIYTNFGSQLSYQYQQRYFVEGALSYGGHNRFAPGKRYGLFYAGGFGVNLTSFDLFKNLSWLSLLKPRLSYGLTGNANVGYYIYDQYYSYGGTSAAYYFGSSPTVARSYAELGLANPYARWEKAQKLNLGLDIGLFNQKLQITSEYFKDQYVDLMQSRGKTIQLIGQSYPSENIGKNNYWGWEQTMVWKDGFKNGQYFLSANWSVLQSKVIFQDEVDRVYDYRKRTGLPVGQPFGYIAQGFYQSKQDIDASPSVDGYTPVPGDIKYRDLNEDGIINQFDETAIGTQKPLMYFGLSSGVTFKSFDLKITVQGVANRDIINANEYNSVSTALEYEFRNGGQYQAYEHHLNRWTPSNASSATYPRLSIGTNPNNHRASSFWVVSGDYVRIQNVDIGYTVSPEWIRPAGLKSLRIFANGFNLYSFDRMRYKDPEGYNSIFPIRKTFNLGVNITL